MRADDIRPYTGFPYLSVGADVLIRPLGLLAMTIPKPSPGGRWHGRKPVTDEGNVKGLETLASEPDIAFPIQGGRCPRRGRMRVTPVGACATGGPLGTAAPTDGFRSTS